jgi:hypothetical protein
VVRQFIETPNNNTFKEEHMKSNEWKCCTDVSCCMSANEVDTSDCPEQDTEGNCCGDESRCADAFGIDEENCKNSVKE